MYLDTIKSNVFKYLKTSHLPVMYLVFKYYFDQVMHFVENSELKTLLYFFKPTVRKEKKIK